MSDKGIVCDKETFKFFSYEAFDEATRQVKEISKDLYDTFEAQRRERVAQEAWEKLTNSVEWNTITIDKDVYQEMQQNLKRFKTMVNLLVTNDFPYNYLRGQSHKELIKRFDSWIEEFVQ